MSEMSRDDLLGVVRRVWEEADPVPDGLVERLQAALALEGTDLDLELMLLVEHSHELAGARGTAAYTLHFVLGETDLLLRIAVDGEVSRVDGWLVPPDPMTVRAVHGGAVEGDGGPRAGASVTSSNGRFELTDLPRGPLHLRFEPHADGSAFATPTFEI